MLISRGSMDTRYTGPRVERACLSMSGLEGERGGTGYVEWRNSEMGTESMMCVFVGMWWIAGTVYFSDGEGRLGRLD
jgi:hypothetical protein